MEGEFEPHLIYTKDDADEVNISFETFEFYYKSYQQATTTWIKDTLDKISFKMLMNINLSDENLVRQNKAIYFAGIRIIYERVKK